MNVPQCIPLGLAPSFGFGDRTGLATPGHVAAMRRSGAGISPIFPQQSIREMSRTRRTPRQVMDDALSGAFQAGWTDPCGADADHLKTRADAESTATVGFTFFTLDPSDHVDRKADHYGENELRERFATVRDQVAWLDKYRGRQVPLPGGGKFEFTEAACLRAAVKYGPALAVAIQLGRDVAKAHAALQRDFEIELSVDETEQPTSLAEHYIIADQCLQSGMKLVSLAPRFIGDCEKGVDYIGDVKLLEKSLADHAAIAGMLGPYKLSLHSGSDKLSMYAALARTTRGRFHVKTAGTSYLEALRVVALHDVSLFRRIIDFSRQHYDRDRATYHVSARLGDAPPTSEADDKTLLREYLENWEDVPRGRGFTRLGRQILHCTFGSVLTDGSLGPLLRGCLLAHPVTYANVLEEHFSRHLEALQSGMQS